MRFLLYTHSLVSDWNHGNAHFLRGVLRELQARGHSTLALEPETGWSRQRLIADQGQAPVQRFHSDFPELRSLAYGADYDHEAAVADADVVIVHEWTDPGIIARLGRYRRSGGRFVLLFHDTHHRAVSDSPAIADLTLQDYDGILAFGETLRQRYLALGWGHRIFTWHEAADDRLFRPLPAESAQDLIWIGNWGDGERSAELQSYLVEPIRQLDLAATVRGVRYPLDVQRQLANAGISFGGWIANADVPSAFARHRVTVHIPRKPYVEALPGIPTIRVFEALACGIPLVCAPWEDSESLFRGGTDYLTATSGADMKNKLSMVLRDRDCAAALSTSGLETIRARHTCRHRVDELFVVLQRLGGGASAAMSASMEVAQ
jgi:spore maturation protein CgeB